MISKELDNEWHSYITINYKDGTYEKVRIPLMGDVASTEDRLLQFKTYHGYSELVGEATYILDNIKSWVIRWEAS